MRRLPHVSLILGIAVFMAADGVKKAEHSSRRTDNSIGTVLDAAQWVSVADGFVLRVFSQKEVTKLSARRAVHEKRRQEFLDKRKPLDERRAAIRRLFPEGTERYRRYAETIFERYDANSDGALDREEQKRLPRDPSAYDADSDGKISIGELVGSYLKEDVPENINELYRELDALDVKTERLTKEYKDVLDRRRAAVTYYKVIEVGKDFLRIRHKKEERIIPFASIREIRRTPDD